MAGKSGRLTFSGRQEYRIVPLYRHDKQGDMIGYVAFCPCELGQHYLTYDESGAIIERTAPYGSGKPYLFATYADAQAAIEAWQAQQAHAAHSGESEAE